MFEDIVARDALGCEAFALVADQRMCVMLAASGRVRRRMKRRIQ